MSKQVLIIGFVWPEPKSSAAGSRMMQLIQTFLEYGYKVTFATTTAKTKNAFNLESIGVTETQIQLNNSSFDSFLSSVNPSIVVFDRFLTEEQFGWRVAEHCPDAVRILDTEDLHFLRKGRQQAFKDKKEFTDKYLFNDTAKREIASIYRCDLSLIISEFEMELLSNTFKIDREILYYIPFLLNELPENIENQLPDYEHRQHFITVGTFVHEPNYQAVLKLKQEIWPAIKLQLPKAELHIYGAYASQKVTQLHNEKEGFLVKGYVDDLESKMQQAKVCLAPLQFGAGLKGKLIDAMVNGVPCVISNIAAEGMFGVLAPNGYVEDDNEAFIDKAIKLYTSESIWKQFQVNGFKIINSRFLKSNFSNSLIERIETLQENLSKHREQNFLGSMLQHHTLQSSKYMSKWIETKNQNSNL